MDNIDLSDEGLKFFGVFMIRLIRWHHDKRLHLGRINEEFFQSNIGEYNRLQALDYDDPIQTSWRIDNFLEKFYYG